MKGLNIKKLAAIAIGGALIGSALAPVVSAAVTSNVDQLQKSDIVNSVTGSPVVNVVAGSGAAPSDFVWAGNIAAKVAQLASVEKTVAVTGGGDASTADPSGLTVDVTVGGTVSYSEASSQVYDNTNLTSSTAAPEFLAVLTDSQMDFLKDETLTYKLNGNSYTQTVEEKIGFQAQAKFDTTYSDIDGDLVALMSNAQDFNYQVAIQDGIPVDFTSADTNRVEMFWFGDKYKVQSVTGTSGSYKLTLMKASASNTFYEGDSLTGLVGKGDYEGQELRIGFDAITETGVSTAAYSADFSLYDGDDTLLDTYTAAATAYLNDQFIDADGDYPLKSVVYVESIAKESTTNRGKIKVTMGTDVVEIMQGKVYPYSSTDTAGGDDYWKALFDTTTKTNPNTGAVSISQVTIYNSNTGEHGRRNNTNPIYGGNDALHEDMAGNNEYMFLSGEDESALGYNFARVVFDGWKNAEATTTLELGEVGGPVPGFAYKDTASALFMGAKSVPFYVETQLDTTGSSFVVAGQTVYYKCAVADVNFPLGNGSDTNALNGVEVGPQIDVLSGYLNFGGFGIGAAGAAAHSTIDINGVTYTIDSNSGAAADADSPRAAGTTWLVADGNCQFSSKDLSQTSTTIADADFLETANTFNTYYYDDANTVAFKANPLSVGATNFSSLTDTYQYALYASEAKNKLWLLLDNSTNIDGYFGDDLNFVGTDTDEDLSIDKSYYWPDIADLEDPSDTTYMMAVFNVTGSATAPWDANVLIDTTTGKPPVLPNTNLNYDYDVNLSSGSIPGASSTVGLRNDDPSNKINKVYTDFGTKIELSADSVLLTVPEQREKLKFSVLGQSTEVTTAGGTAFTGLADGDTEKSGSTEVTVDAINYTVGECGAGGAVANPSTYMDTVSVGQLVYLDMPKPAGANIIVGGWLVNKLVTQSTSLGEGTLGEALTASGDRVVQLLDNGDIVVAGLTANDTKLAAQDLINALDALMA